MLSIAAAFIPRTASQAAQPAATLPLPSNTEELDALLQAHDWKKLSALLSKDDRAKGLGLNLQWLRTRLDAGGGTLLGVLYSRDLWLVGVAYNVEDPQKDLRIFAAKIALYTFALIWIDGAKCGDLSAAPGRAGQLVAARHDALAFLRKQSADFRERIVDAAIAMEQETASLRDDDDYICRGGMEQMRAGIEKGSRKEIPTPPGGVGRSIEVEAPAGWSPSFVSPMVYLPLQDKHRAEMKDSLRKLVGL
jgi:hypothetical protein